MPYGKGKATGYSDYFKGNTKTPGGSFDDEEDTILPASSSKPPKDEAGDRLRKEALKRRLARKKKVGK